MPFGAEKIETKATSQMSSIVREFIEAILLALVVFVAIQTSVQNFKVEGSSMQPTLEGGQYLLVNKLVYFKIDQERLSRIIPFWKVDNSDESFAVHPPKSGEVIVFHFPRDHSRDFVKRVIGVPGDWVEIRRGTVYVNGGSLDEPYITAHDYQDMGQVFMDEKEYFVLGDNRRGSNDSRNWGSVPEALILGKVWIVYWPLSNWTLLQ
jgi:signal peptidase I